MRWACLPIRDYESPRMKLAKAQIPRRSGGSDQAQRPRCARNDEWVRLPTKSGGGMGQQPVGANQEPANLAGATECVPRRLMNTALWVALILLGGLGWNSYESYRTSRRDHPPLRRGTDHECRDGRCHGR